MNDCLNDTENIYNKLLEEHEKLSEMFELSLSYYFNLKEKFSKVIMQSISVDMKIREIVNKENTEEENYVKMELKKIIKKIMLISCSSAFIVSIIVCFIFNIDYYLSLLLIVGFPTISTISSLLFYLSFYSKSKERQKIKFKSTDIFKQYEQLKEKSYNEKQIIEDIYKDSLSNIKKLEEELKKIYHCDIEKKMELERLRNDNEIYNDNADVELTPSLSVDVHNKTLSKKMCN